MLAILVLLFVCVVFWMGGTLFSSQRDTKIDPELTRLAKPLSPTLDVTVIEQIEEKRQYTEDELANFTIYKIVLTKSTREERVVSIDTDVESLEETDEEQSGGTTEEQSGGTTTSPFEALLNPGSTATPSASPTPTPAASPDAGESI